MSDLIEGCAFDACGFINCVRAAECEAAGRCMEPSSNYTEAATAIVSRVLAAQRRDLSGAHRRTAEYLDAFEREHLTSAGNAPASTTSREVTRCDD